MLGNLEAKRDWGYAPDYIEAMWLMLQQDTPDDYVIATGETRSIKEFLDEAFKFIGIENWSSYVKVDSKFMRPAEVDVLRGDYTKAKKQLGWAPKTNFTGLVKIMVQNDINLLKK
jgi:GDPmannose 4,6-dehydratase